ncbi:uncharacterized protein EV422DRAFT_622711 [Fimicolochytrium jonesii]|uniref:uncharacterized protein n=1 Tax=Fimicolochytrium jonesii TaxID=1396493 RepID=UPI0022FEA649|nr:uncharacterized protein EV422DRAFT_622711 [Fimicolochytrium jonesii]KAI8817228.1 hypothetical protein EV422DRAFT_622711 [Fimicolochytrium jonesii]
MTGSGTGRGRGKKRPATPSQSPSAKKKKGERGTDALQPTIHAFFGGGTKSGGAGSQGQDDREQVPEAVLKGDQFAEWEEWPPETWHQKLHPTPTSDSRPISESSVPPRSDDDEDRHAGGTSDILATFDTDSAPAQDSIPPPHNPPPPSSAALPPLPPPILTLSSTSDPPPSSPTPDIRCDIPPPQFDATALPAYWTPGSPTPYRWLADQFALVEKVTGRQIITSVLTNMLRTIIYTSPTDLLPALYLCSNSIAPPYKGIELGIGPQILLKSITAISDLPTKSIRQAWEQKGDWGDVVVGARRGVGTLAMGKSLRGRLTVQEVYKTLHRIAALRGAGTVNAKTELVKKVMVACQGEELRYLTRTLVAHLRIGAVRTTVLIALSHAILLEKSLTPAEVRGMKADALKARMKGAEAVLKECYAQVPNYDIIVPLLMDPAVGLERIGVECKCIPGVPIRPMLGKITRDLAEVFETMHGLNFCADWKYDGQRAQIHRTSTGQVHLFSRHLETMTDKYPDIVALVPSVCRESTTSFILDAEVVAVEEGQGEGEGKKYTVASFQTLSNRARKNVHVRDVKVHVCVMAFDLMYLNGRSLIEESFRTRRDAMRAAFAELEGGFGFVPQLESKDPDEVQAFLHLALQSGCEGLMVKILDSPPPSLTATLPRHLSTYAPDKRSQSWLKVKRDYLTSLADSFDLVPIGAWHGSGRKAGWWSPFLMACVGADGRVESFCKCMSGFTDAFYKENKERYSHENHTLLPAPKPYYVVHESMRPDVWFEPLEVWELRGADLTVSPVHQAAMGRVEADKGISLRFPRFIRKREDKNVEDATGPDEIVEIFHRQRVRGPPAAGDLGGGEGDGDGEEGIEDGDGDGEEEGDGDVEREDG